MKRMPGGRRFRPAPDSPREAIARVKRIATARHCQIDYIMRVQISQHRIGADVVCLIRLLDVQRMAVRICIDGHRLYAQLRTGAYDTYCNLSPVGDEIFLITR